MDRNFNARKAMKNSKINFLGRRATRRCYRILTGPAAALAVLLAAVAPTQCQTQALNSQPVSSLGTCEICDTQIHTFSSKEAHPASGLVYYLYRTRGKLWGRTYTLNISLT